MTNKNETDQIDKAAGREASDLSELLCCDHDWELKDESFDHEFGCEQVHYYECVKCEETRDLGAADWDPFIDSAT